MGTLAPLFLVQVSIGTMPVSQKIFQTPSGVKLLGWRSYGLGAAWWYSELDVFVGTYQVSCKKLVSMAITTFLGL